MKVVHCIELEFEEIIDDSKIGEGSREEIAAAARNYTEQVEELCKAIEADGLTKKKEIYGLRKPFCICDVLRGIADSIENGECKCCDEEDDEEEAEEEKCE